MSSRGVRELVTSPTRRSRPARKDLDAIVEFIKNPNPPMPKLFPNPLADADVRPVAEYVRMLHRSPPQ
jgi:hypothetical protein